MPLPIRMLISVRKEDGRTDEFSKGIVTLVILLNVAFTVAILYTFLKIGDEPTVLIGCYLDPAEKPEVFVGSGKFFVCCKNEVAGAQIDRDSYFAITGSIIAFMLEKVTWTDRQWNNEAVKPNLHTYIFQPVPSGPGFFVLFPR